MFHKSLTTIFFIGCKKLFHMIKEIKIISDFINTSYKKRKWKSKIKFLFHFYAEWLRSFEMTDIMFLLRVKIYTDNLTQIWLKFQSHIAFKFGYLDKIKINLHIYKMCLV